MSPDPSTPPGTESPSDHRPIVAIILVALLAYWSFPFAELFWDDKIVITPTGTIASLATIRDALTGTCVLFPPSYGYAYYRPVVDITLILEYAIAGTSPFLYHLTSFALHLASALLFHRLLRRRAGLDPWVAALAVAPFLAHPLQVESVLWPAARPAVLATFFFLLSVQSWFACREATTSGARILWGSGVILFHIISLLSKEVAISFYPPFLLAAILLRKRLLPVDWILGVMVSALIGGYLILHTAISARSGPSLPLDFLARACVELYGFYLGKLFLPTGLIPSREPFGFEGTTSLLIGLTGVIASFAVIGWGLWRRTPTTLVAMAGAILAGGAAVLPLFGGQVYAADRYFYQSFIGIGVLIAVALGSAPLVDSLSLRHRATVALMALGLLALMSAQQSALWLREDILWAHTVEVDPSSTYGNAGLGNYFEAKGDLTRAAQHFAAAAFAERKVEQHADRRCALDLSRVAFLLDDYPLARRAAEKARLDEAYAADATFRLALISHLEGDQDAARQLLSEIEDPGNLAPAVYFNIARLGRELSLPPEEVLAWYEKARKAGLEPQPTFENTAASPAP